MRTYLLHIWSILCAIADAISKKVLDNHATHVSLTAVEFCRDHGIVSLTIPPKASHKLQPLGVAVYNPFNKYYANDIDAWHRNHHRQTMNICDIPVVIQHTLKHLHLPISQKDFSLWNCPLR